MQKAMEFEEIEITEQQEYALISSDFTEFIKSLIRQYQLEINAGIKLIREYNAMCPFILNILKEPEDNREDYRSPILELRTRKGNKHNLINDFVKDVRTKYWAFLFKSNSFVGKLTTNLQGYYHNRINEMTDYEFSIYNILTVKEDIERNIVKGVEETILDLFDEFSEKHSFLDETSKNVHYYNGWKTNKAHKINSKIIIPFYEYRCSYSDTYKKMEDITKVFDYLDMGQTSYPYSIRDTIEYNFKGSKTRNIELKYFDVTFFKKGTCHIKFKNLELLEKFNLYGSQRKGWLPPHYGKKPYQDMNKEEKDIVQEFSGSVLNYNKIYNNQQYYLVSNPLMLQVHNE
jgi:hypothetical protein